MPCVNYVKEHIAFIEYAADNNLRPNEILVWEALFHVMNQRANGNYWPDGFIRVKNDRLLTYAPIGFDSLARARNSLAQRGLISYKPGKKNSEVPMYELHYLTAANNPQLHDEPVDKPVENFSYPLYYPQIADNSRGNMRDNIMDNAGGNVRGKLSDQYINLNKGKTDPNEACIDDDDDVVVAATRARARAEQTTSDAFDEFDEDGVLKRHAAAAEAVKRGMKQYFGRDALPAEAARFGTMAANLGFSDEMIMLALHNAAVEGARNPFGYCAKILKEWKYEEVTTPDEYGEYAYLADCRDGRIQSLGQNADIYEKMKQGREERRAKHEAKKGGCDYGGYSASGI